MPNAAMAPTDDDSNTRRGQRIEQLPEPAFALAQTRLRSLRIDRHDISAERRGPKCGDRSIEFAFQKSG